MSDTLYERLGGADAIEAVVDRFYERVLADDDLVEFFEDVDMQRQRAHQAAFLKAATGGPDEYDGENMRRAHEHLDVEDEDFDAIVEHLDATLREFDVDDEDREAVLETIEDTRGDVVTAPAGD